MTDSETVSELLESYHAWSRYKHTNFLNDTETKQRWTHQEFDLTFSFDKESGSFIRCAELWTQHSGISDRELGSIHEVKEWLEKVKSNVRNWDERFENRRLKCQRISLDHLRFLQK